MTTGYSTDYREGRDLIGKGREVTINDGYMTYTYDLHDGDTLQDALSEFCDTYTFDPDGDDPLTIPITAAEYVDGEEINAIRLALTLR